MEPRSFLFGHASEKLLRVLDKTVITLTEAFNVCQVKNWNTFEHPGNFEGTSFKEKYSIEPFVNTLSFLEECCFSGSG